MIDIPVSSVMRDSPVRLSPETKMAETAKHLRHPDVAALVVCDPMDVPVGFVTESDIVAVVAEGEEDVTVESFMATPVSTVSDKTPIGIAADRMRDAGVTTLAVVDEEDACEGIVTREDLAPYLSRHRLEIEWNDGPLSLDERAGDIPNSKSGGIDGATE